METLRLALGYFNRSIASSEMETYLRARSRRLLASVKSDFDMIFFPLSIPIRTRENSIFRYSLFFLINHRQELPTSILNQGYLRDFPVHHLSPKCDRLTALLTAKLKAQVKIERQTLQQSLTNDSTTPSLQQRRICSTWTGNLSVSGALPSRGGESWEDCGFCFLHLKKKPHNPFLGKLSPIFSQPQIKSEKQTKPLPQESVQESFFRQNLSQTKQIMKIDELLKNKREKIILKEAIPL